MSKKVQAAAGPRDTAKDIILGTQPSGLQPRDTRSGMIRQLDPPDPSGRGMTPSSGDPVVEARLASAERSNKALMQQIMELQNGLRGIQRVHEEQLNQDQVRLGRMEAAVKSTTEALGRMSERSKFDPTMQQDIESTKQAKAALEAQVLRMTQDVAHIKRIVDQHSNDLMALNNEVRSRPVVDPSKLQNTAQFTDQRLRDLHGEVMVLRQAIDGEINERRRNDQEHVMNLSRLQSQLVDQDGRRNEILKQLALQDNLKGAASSEETKRLNDKITLITDEVTKALLNKEQRLRDETNEKYLILEKAIKAELEARLQYEREVRQYLESRYKGYGDEMEQLRQLCTTDRTKNKEKFMKLNEALAVIEKHLEQGNKKVDRVMAAEIQSRKLHEKGLLAKLQDIEDRLGNHMGSLNRAVDDIRKSGKGEVPALDTDGLRKEMDAIAGDKHKLTMEGMLQLEQKIQRIERSLDRDVGDVHNKMENNGWAEGADLGKLDPDSMARLRFQLRKLKDTQEEIEKAHDQMRDKIEKQIPQDIEELNMKVDNSKRQLGDRLEAEERKRQLQVRELQDDIARLKNRPVRGMNSAAGTNAPAEIDDYRLRKLEENVNEAQVGVKKLAESVTTIRNVLGRRIDDEARARERAVEKLEDKINR